MIGAIVKDNIVQNLIVIREVQIPEMEQTLGCEIVNASYYGLQVGDLRIDNGWTRNYGGEQMLLKPSTQEDYDSYSLNMRKIMALEEAQESIAENSVKEAIDILSGLDAQEEEKE